MLDNKDVTKRIRVYGIVQGVGFRPTVARHAAAAGIRGSVCNKGPYVEIYAQGSPEQVSSFLEALEHRPPKRAAILKIDVRDAMGPKEPRNPASFSDFSIIESEKTKGEIFISPDIAICDECREEMYDPGNPRYLHPFINCTCCGPRLTILDALPYDRHRTSMKVFPMCPRCRKEYYDPASRRYDAQPVCCNDCGPQVYLAGRKERGREAITFARKTILSGGVVAVKGIGGFHLCCDASSQEAVMQLRERKRRPMKPFAVMMRDLETVKRECTFSPAQEEILTGHQKPILLLERKAGGKLCSAIAPGNPKVGVMLPYAPVQLLLFDYDDGLIMPDTLVMTSGNISGAPICRDDEEALRELGHLCDCILSHDRMIRIRCDDSVMDFYRDTPYMIRRSRGYAPLPYMMSEEMKGCVLAMGGELKNTFCIGTGGLFYPSSYIGDLEDLRSVKALRETVGRMETLLETEPELVVCDLHPRYNSSLLAREYGLPVLEIQHHYAHIASCLAENDFAGRVIGVSFDGTGYGSDGTIWGGEILTADFEGFERAAHIRPFLQVGGDASSREGWRIAASMIYSLIRDRDKALQIIRDLDLCDDRTARVQLMMADKKLNSVVSTSAGRLFDGAAALLGIRKASTFEGEAATALQFAAEKYVKEPETDQDMSGYHQGACISSPDWLSPSEEEGGLVLQTDLLFGDLLERRLKGEDPGRLAWIFHRHLADMIIRACIRIRERTGLMTCALSGGVFQNTLLLGMVQEGLEKEGFKVLIHSLVPPNDGGIALGQAAAGLYRKSKGLLDL